MDKKPWCFGKRFLITQPMIRSFCGSTMVTLELAEYLRSAGAQVTIYTNIALSPAIDSFKSVGVKILSPKDDPKCSLKDYDYVWVHSLTFPRHMLEELKKPFKRMPAFIFLHMSPLDTIPDEHPWIFDLENSLSSLSLYISEMTLKSNEKYGLPLKTGFFRNPAPSSFEELAARKITKNLKKILIVSNHPPKEVLEAKKILESWGINVEVYGERRDKYEPITPSVLKKYDAAITIGKTVQYCIVGSMPVYIYDWFGGPGWLTEENYEHTKRNNYSGRFSEQKTGKKIAQELVDGFNDALDFHINYLAEDKKEYIIDYVMRDLFKDLKKRKIERLDDKYIESAKAAVYCAEIRFNASEELGKAYEYCDDLKMQLGDREKRIQQLEEFRKKYDELANSKRIKLLDTVLKPHDKVKEYLKKKSVNL